jgi:hypothetical protein
MPSFRKSFAYAKWCYGESYFPFRHLIPVIRSLITDYCPLPATNDKQISNALSVCLACKPSNNRVIYCIGYWWRKVSHETAYSSFASFHLLPTGLREEKIRIEAARSRLPSNTRSLTVLHFLQELPLSVA